VPIIASVSMFTVGYAIDATYRRLELPPEERFRVPYRKWLAQTRQVAFHPESRAWFWISITEMMLRQRLTLNRHIVMSTFGSIYTKTRLSVPIAISPLNFRSDQYSFLQDNRKGTDT